MSSQRLRPDVFRFFERLPYLPLKELTRNLNRFELIKLSFISDKWRDMVHRGNLESPTKIHLKCEGEVLEVLIKIGEAYRKKKRIRFQIRFFPGETEAIEMRSDEEMNVYTRDSKQHVARRIFDVCQHFVTKDSVDFGRFNMDESTWMGREDLMNINCNWGVVGENRLTSHDFNCFLHHWADGLNENVSHLEFRVGDHVRIEDVLKGFLVNKWDPEKRERKFLKTPVYGVFPVPLDLADGQDIRNRQGTLATVHITQNVLYFCVWRSQYLRVRYEIVLGDVRDYHRMEYTTAASEKEKLVEKYKRDVQSLRNIRGDQNLPVDIKKRLGLE